MSIESKHGVDEPGGRPPTRAERLEATGAKLQAAGKQTSALGGALVRLGCSGFILLFIVLVVIALLSSGGSHHSSTPASSSEAAKTNCEHPSAAEPCEGRALEEWHREHGETPLRVQDGEEAPDEEEQQRRETKEKEAKEADETVREGLRAKEEGSG
jgi:hypothetical protein